MPEPSSNIEVSFEFFPPSTAQMETTLWHAIERLAPFETRFVSVTYGAAGSTRERTHATVERILAESPLTPAAHLTCVDATREEIDIIVKRYWELGVRHLVALRGDSPDEDGRFRVTPGGYANALELVDGIRRQGDFDVTVAAYPESHPDATSAAAEIDYLKRKIDAGATRAITQFFFDVDVYLRFVERVRSAGIDVPIVPGILPVTNFRKVVEFAGRCKATVPGWIIELFQGLDEDPETRKLVAATVAAELCCKLKEQGVRQYHFYTLNRAEPTRSICHILGLRAGQSRLSQVA